jgi:hypothetical protein
MLEGTYRPKQIASRFVLEVTLIIYLLFSCVSYIKLDIWCHRCLSMFGSGKQIPIVTIKFQSKKR